MLKKQILEKIVLFTCSLVLALALGLFLAAQWQVNSVSAQSKQPTPLPTGEPQPTPDRLAIPELPENPTQVELGNQVYYYNCMPCHGDRGQGLTDEFRQIWVEDHQNCWEYGCHGGHFEDQGFPLPRQIPAVFNLPGSLARFSTAQDLFDFLKETHPPQRPGALKEDEYWDVTALLLAENGRLAPEGEVGPVSHVDLAGGLAVLAGFIALTVLVSARLVAQTRDFSNQ